ncbi:MAG TPA: hypothetical protein VK922_08385 [Gemmatimonadaceae bacterium]|nr:hypothetical protein [Gemmatimonadaceae bacterium]
MRVRLVTVLAAVATLAALTVTDASAQRRTAAVRPPRRPDSRRRRP